MNDTLRLLYDRITEEHLEELQSRMVNSKHFIIKAGKVTKITERTLGIALYFLEVQAAEGGLHPFD